MTLSSAVLDAPQVSSVVARLRSGDSFVALTAERAQERAAALEDILHVFTGDETRVAWVGNPLRSPLTIERFILQIAGPEIDLRIERSPADLARLFAQATGREKRLLVIVQQPETINPETEEALGAMAVHLDRQTVKLQFLFVGSPTLRLPRLQRPLPDPPTVPFSPPPPAPSVSPPPLSHIPTDRVSRRRDVLPVVVLILAAGLAGYLSLHPGSDGARPDPAHVRLGIGLAASQQESGPTAEISRMRGEFDSLLDTNASTLPSLTPAQKDALFDEFVARYHSR